MAKLSTRSAGPSLPHHNVLARLGVSDIHGVGVFAACPIPAGTNVFPADQAEIVWVPATMIDDPALSDFERSLYRDFAIRRGAELGCPVNFSLLTVGWYVNEPRPGEPPNLEPTEQFDLVAARDIEAGEELTVLYSSFSKSAR
jgi:hypothetical protein